MIVLDTNVLSEPLKPMPNQAVLDWLERQPASALYATSVTVFEMMDVVVRLPEGKRRSALEKAVRAAFEALEGRILPFDVKAAEACAALMSQARGRGFTVSLADAMIGATADANNFRVATADEMPFKALGVVVVNPWTA